MNPIKVLGEDAIELHATDFAEDFFIRHLVGTQDRGLYAILRACGHDQLSSFIVTLGKQFTGHPDDLAAAAQAFEGTRYFKNLYEDACERLGKKRLQAEWAARCASVSVMTKDAEMALRLEFADAPIEFPAEHATRAAGKEWEAFAASQRQQQLEKLSQPSSPINWERV
jgi:hypothetical protein